MGHEKTACPGRIAWKAAHGLLIGLLGGAVVVAVTDVGDGRTARQVVESVAVRAPAFAVMNGVIMAFYTITECSFEHMRNTQDSLNCFLAGGITGVLLGAPQGPQPMMIYGVLGALTFGIIDGLL